MTVSYTLFDTPIGPCGIAWNERGIARIQLPESSRGATIERLLGGRAGTTPRVETGSPRRAKPSSTPGWVREAMERVSALLQGRSSELSGVRLDLSKLPPFHRRVYEAARTIGPGQTATYGEVAARAGSPLASRAVGQALSKNPFPIVVPCHRVLASGGKPGGFSAYGGTDIKARLLAIEGVQLTTSSPRARSAAGLSFDVEKATRALAASDRKLADLIERVGPCKLALGSMPRVFDALVESIIYQQLTGKAAATILERFGASFGTKRFPTPQEVLAVSDEHLRGAGLSRSKALAIRDLATKVLDGTVPTPAALRRMTDEEVVERLVAIRGVGRWTAEMLLIFRLGRPDVLPVHDYGVRKGFALTYRMRELPTPAELAKRGERWRPYRTVASWYFWRALD